MFLVSSHICLQSIHWSQVLSWERRCSWSSADRRCSNYIWIIIIFIAHKGATYIRCFTVDELTACQQLKSLPSLSHRSLHLTLVTKRSWSLSWMTYSHPPCSMSMGHPILRYSYFKIWPWKSLVKAMLWSKGQGYIWPWKFKGQGHGQGQTYWSHLRPGVQLICLLFVSWQSDHFWLRYSKFDIWPWKFKVKVMAKVKTDSHIWGLEFNWYVCFSFRGNRTISRYSKLHVWPSKFKVRSQQKLTKI